MVATKRPPAAPAARVKDRRGRTWTITVTTIDGDDGLAPWIDLSPDQRLELIGECVLDGLRLEDKLDVPRLRRVLRVSERKSREVPRRRTLRGRLPRQAAGDEGHRRPRR
jgi:hypothetical protein